MAIAFDAANSAPNTLTWSHTCTGSNLVLLVQVYSLFGNITAVTYNSVAMSQLFSENAGGYAVWSLLAPATGANTVSVTLSGASAASDLNCASMSYSGVKQSGFPDSYFEDESISPSSPDTLATTVVAANCWLIGFYVANRVAVSPPSISSNRTDRVTSNGTSNTGKSGIVGSDSNGIVSTGSQSIVYTFSGSNLNANGGVALSLAPFVASATAANTRQLMMGVGQ